MFLKLLIIFISFFSTAYSLEIDEHKFYHLCYEELLEIECFKNQLCDSSDIYTYYYLKGKQEAIIRMMFLMESCEKTQD